MKYCSVDESQFPMVKIYFHLKDPTLLQFNQFLDEQKRLLTYQKEFVLLMDATKVGFLSSEIRIAQGNFFKEYNDTLKKYCLGAVLLVSSSLVKMMIKGMMLISAPPNQTLICSNENEARVLAENLIKKQKFTIREDHLVIH
jgi:hypothetical protein